MGSRTSRQGPIAGRIAAIERHHGPGDPRLPELRAQLAGTRAAEDLADWAARAAATLPPLVADEVAAVATMADWIERKLADAPPLSEAQLADLRAKLRPPDEAA